MPGWKLRALTAMPPFKVAYDNVTSFSGYGMGSYSFFNHIFNQSMDIFAANAFRVPTTLSPGSMHDLLYRSFCATSGTGGIQHVINGTGGSSTIANPDTPVTVVRAIPNRRRATRVFLRQTETCARNLAMSGVAFFARPVRPRFPD